MSTAHVVSMGHVAYRQLGTTQLEIVEVVWSDLGRSFEVYRADNGEDLTEDGCFDAVPTDDQIRELLDCQHENKRLDDRSQFHCLDCGEELGR